MKEDKGKRKVSDLDYQTGEFRSNYNLNYRIPRCILIYFHNLFGYDAHLFLKEFRENYDNIKLILNNYEKYIYHFSKIIKYDSGLRSNKDGTIFNNTEFRFLDSFKFLSILLNI